MGDSLGSLFKDQLLNALNVPLTVFVGEQPGGSPGSRGAFEGGQSAERLAWLMGENLVDFKKKYSRTNLIEVSGQSWDATFAKERANLLTLIVPTNSALILCGRKVAEAFEVSAPLFRPVERYHFLTLVVMPHPSGRCRWWNDPAHCDLAVEELRKYRR